MAMEPAENGCPGPHRQCQACTGQRMEFRETLYVPDSGSPQGVVAPHVCWYCQGRGFYCHGPRRCTPEPR
ncbi:hypothetical protein RM780_21625 [Streptomyces sp. DSM 44917]|uniref:Uncharacterized protein n=1 Tax=Streptomyces boetiae TaxID=3075541 RepID=A0ABU2LDF5_9ACTN|nr:hypothetical protein [Streptomyces sp. DSM 44917]MDT0309537.1 hypothetical protein [Streptomyces sp. DSM 44917]